MKKIVGLDLGIASVGWAFVIEDDKYIKSKIINSGVRLVPLSSDEKKEFSSGKALSTNAGRTMKRGMRRNNYRYKMRRNRLINLLKEMSLISDDTLLAEDGKLSHYETIALRDKAATERIEKHELARVLLAINKKRGYKSNRKAKNDEETKDGSQLSDDLAIAEVLKSRQLTPGQLALERLEKGEEIPDFYRSDLANEFETIWKIQSVEYPELLDVSRKKDVLNSSAKGIIALFEKVFGVTVAQVNGSRSEKEKFIYDARAKAACQVIEQDKLAIVFRSLLTDLASSSGYLSRISDLSKQLHFNNWTVGQYLHQQITESPSNSLKNQIFQRRDYLNEFERIWGIQQRYHPELTSKMKGVIRDEIIFYQRRLKSQKHLVGNCTLEPGNKTIPRSAPLFQWFRIWQNLNNLKLENKNSVDVIKPDFEQRKLFFEILNTQSSLSKRDIFSILDQRASQWNINYEKLEGNRFQNHLVNLGLEICEAKGIVINPKKVQGVNLLKILTDNLESLGVCLPFLTLENLDDIKNIEAHPQYLLWHLLYSYEGDGTSSGEGKLIKRLCKKYGLSADQAKKLANIPISDQYGNLSAKAIKNILPGLLEGMTYDEAASLAEYRHSLHETSDERDARELKDALPLMEKNSLRNPVVEKILNQVVHVVNAIIADPEMGRPDEIRIELGRDLKMNAKQRSEMESRIKENTKKHEEIKKVLRNEFGITRKVSRKDIIRYKLYKELEPNGYKTLYTNKYIDKGMLFTNEVDVDHILPQSLFFDDSFSNKILTTRSENLDKSNTTAIDYVANFGEEAVGEYRQRIKNIFGDSDRLTTKQRRLLTSKEEIPTDFLNRDLGNTQYIAKAAMEMLKQVCRIVTPSTGKITARLRKDWGLIDVLKDLNWEKYEAVGLTSQKITRNDRVIRTINDWSKRNDHRHHAMDAITVAFTRPAIVQLLNNLNARDKKDSLYWNIQNRHTYYDQGKLRFKAPVEQMRSVVKAQLSNLLVSRKAKNKVTTLSKNRIKVKGKKSPNVQVTQAPRGPLHEETVYGKSKRYETWEEKIGSKFDKEKIQLVSKKAYRDALLKRIEEFGDDPKKAFLGKNSLLKNPIILTGQRENQVPEKVKLVKLKTIYTIRKPLNKDFTKGHVEKVLDVGIRRKLEKRIKDNGGDAKKAFSDLEKSPIWLDEKKGISLKRVTIEGPKSVEVIHEKKNHHGDLVFDDENKAIPADFVMEGNNHHTGIYRDEKGKLQDEIVSFFEAVARKNNEIPIVKKEHEKGWNFLFTLKKNEFFIFPPEDFKLSTADLLTNKYKKEIYPYLFYLVSQSKLFYGNSIIRSYDFRHHAEATTNDLKPLKNIIWKRIQSLKGLEGIIKVRLDHLGNIVQVGEY